MKISPALSISGALLIAGTGWSCTSRPDDWSPVLEETSTTFLETEMDRAGNDVEAALDQIRTDPAGAEASLQRASQSLDFIRSFYLPLFQARERAYNAYRYYRLNDRGRVEQELEAIEATLASMAEQMEGNPIGELQGLAEAAADARVAVSADSEESGDALESLARGLNQALLKGDLILR